MDSSAPRQAPRTHNEYQVLDDEDMPIQDGRDLTSPFDSAGQPCSTAELQKTQNQASNEIIPDYSGNYGTVLHLIVQ